jgi:hypothetical protein
MEEVFLRHGGFKKKQGTGDYPLTTPAVPETAAADQLKQTIAFKAILEKTETPQNFAARLT